MNKLKEIKIRLALLYIVWVIYVVLWAWTRGNRSPSDLEIVIEYGIPWIAVLLAAVSLANRARAYKIAQKGTSTGDFWSNIEH